MKAYAIPMMINTPSIPHIFSISGRNIGPMIADPVPNIDCNAKALTKCSRGNKFGTIACLEGMSSESKTPLIREIAIRCHGCITLNTIRRPVIRAVTAKQPRVIVTKRTRLIRSAITPPHIDKTNIGPNPVKVNIPK